MNPVFQRIMIACDLSEMDEQLLAFTKLLIQNQVEQKFYLVHIVPVFSHPKDKSLAFHKRFTTKYPIDEKVREILAERMKIYFSDLDGLIELKVIEGQPYHQLLRWMEIKKIDLLVVGNKSQLAESGITTKRMARKAYSSVALVTINHLSNIKKILVPIDFSFYSAMALKKALELKAVYGASLVIEALHVLEVLPTDQYYGLSLNLRFLDSLVEDARERYRTFLEKNEIDKEKLLLTVFPNSAGNISRQLHQYIQKETPDLVIMGAKGHAAIENIFIGSVSEQLVDICKETPVLLIR